MSPRAHTLALARNERAHRLHDLADTIEEMAEAHDPATKALLLDLSRQLHYRARVLMPEQTAALLADEVLKGLEAARRPR